MLFNWAFIQKYTEHPLFLDTNLAVLLNSLLKRDNRGRYKVEQADTWGAEVRGERDIEGHWIFLCFPLARPP